MVGAVLSLRRPDVFGQSGHHSAHPVPVLEQSSPTYFIPFSKRGYRVSCCNAYNTPCGERKL